MTEEDVAVARRLAEAVSQYVAELEKLRRRDGESRGRRRVRRREGGVMD